MTRILEIWRFRELLLFLLKINIITKYRWSVLGVFWSLFNPLLTFLVYAVAFNYIIRINIENYTLFLLAGLIPWTFFSSSVLSSSYSLIEHSSLISKVKIPKEVIPLSSVAFQIVQLSLTMIVFIPFFIFWNNSFYFINILYLAILILFIIFTTGCCLIISSLSVIYRDLQHITSIIITFLFWASPIVYGVSLIPDDWKLLFLANPITLFMICFHDLLYRDVLPHFFILLGVTIWSLGAVYLGFLIFKSVEPRLTEEI